VRGTRQSREEILPMLNISIDSSAVRMRAPCVSHCRRIAAIN
jgi:hypothetical protein